MHNLKITLIAFILACLPMSSMAATLTDILLKSLEGQGKATWSEGYRSNQIETLKNVILRMDDGRRYDIETLILDYKGGDYIMEAINAKMNPENRIGLLKADRMKYEGDPGLLRALWASDKTRDGCIFMGLSGKMSIEGFGLILFDGLYENAKENKYQIKSMNLGTDISGDLEKCRANISILIEDYREFSSDGSSNHTENFGLSMSLPGSLKSLALDISQNIDFDMHAKDMEYKIPGSSIAWSFEDGHIQGESRAITLVPLLNFLLKQNPAHKKANALLAWNAAKEVIGKMTLNFNNLVIFPANNLPTDYAGRFANSNLSSILLDMNADFDISPESSHLNGEMDVTGVMNVGWEMDFRLGSYPNEAISRSLSNTNILFDKTPPIYIDNLRHAYVDQGLIESAGDIIGIPLTVWINEIREEWARNATESEDIIRDIMTKFASFLAFGRDMPPALLELSVNKTLDLRQALIVAKRAHEEIPSIFQIDISSIADQKP